MTESGPLPELQVILTTISRCYQNDFQHSEMKNAIKLLNNVLTDLHPLDVPVIWSTIRDSNTIHQLKDYLILNLTDPSIQVFGFRLFGNIADNEEGIKLIVDDDIYMCVINTLQQSQYSTSPLVLAEGFRALGLIAKNSEHHGRSINRHNGKWCNQVTKILSEQHRDADVVVNGVMSLSYIFQYNAESDYTMLKWRVQLFRSLLEEHADHMDIQFHLMRLFTVLTNAESVVGFIQEQIHTFAMRNVKKWPDNSDMLRSAAELFEKLAYYEREVNDSINKDDGSEDTVLLKVLQSAGIINTLKEAILSEGYNNTDVIHSGLHTLEYLEEYNDCSEEDAAAWSDYLFSLIETHTSGSDDNDMLEVACRGLTKLHEVRRNVPVSEAQCRLLINTIFLHHEDIYIFTCSCGAIGEILPKMPQLAITLLKNGIHMKVLDVMKRNPSKEDVQYVGCLFMINFQLQLSTETRLKAQFDSRGILTELSRLFSDRKHAVVVKEFCLGAITLLFRDTPVRLACQDTPQLYRSILTKAKTYGLISYLNQITLMLVSLLCTQEKIAHDLLYNEHDTFGLRVITGLICRNYKYKEWVMSGLLAMSSLLNCKIDPRLSVDGVPGALKLLSDLITNQYTDGELMKYVIKTLISFSALDTSTKLNIIELVIPRTLDIFSENEDRWLCYLIYKLWSKLADGKQTRSAMLSKAIKCGDAIGVQIFLEMCADVNIPYNETYPITAAVESRDPKIVEHVLWQNVDLQQVKVALRAALRDAQYPCKVDILGYLLRDCGYKAQDNTIDWCNLELTDIEPEWLFIIMDLNHVHYSKPEAKGRKISLASKAAEVKPLLIKLQGVEQSLLSLEFEEWLNKSPTTDPPESPDVSGNDKPATVLTSKTEEGFMDQLQRELSKKFLAVETNISYRESDALRDLYNIDTTKPRMQMRKDGSLKYPRQTSASFTSINVSNNMIESIDRLGTCTPIMKKLGEVLELNFNHNRIKQIPESFGSYMRGVKSLDLSYNRLQVFPLCVLNMHLEILNLSNNEMDCLPADNLSKMFCPSLKTLEISSNSLKSIPGWFKEICPNLQNLDFSNNSIQLLPGGSFGFEKLKTLNFSNNQIATVPDSFFQHMKNLQILDMSNNYIVRICKTLPECLTCLQNLYLANNRLDLEQADMIKLLPRLRRLVLANNKISGKTPNLSAFASDQLEELDVSGNVEITQLVIGSNTRLQLEQLKISHTKISELGPDIGQLSNLTTLDISYTNISNLPIEMGNLTKLQQPKLEGLDDLDIPSSIVKNFGIIQFLRQKLKKSRPHYRIKLFVVGLEKRGKTSLCTSIIKRPKEKADVATVGVVKTDWLYKGVADHVISIWDFAGQEEFYATHQCFLSQRGIYLVVFSLQLGASEVERIKPWLYTIQARAPNAPVIIVGTHRDKAEENNVDLTVIMSKVIELSHSAAREFFPKIERVLFVNALQANSAGMSELRLRVINVAENAEAAPADCNVGRGKKVKIMGEMVPACFLELERFVSDTNILETNTYSPFPVLTHDELVTQLQQNNFEIEKEDLRNATSFLHDCGVMLHYNDFTAGLDNLYFIQPEWLSDIFARIITIREGNPWVKEGLLKKDRMLSLLEKLHFNEELINKLVHIMERFEIVLNIDKEQILIPSKLPSTRPDSVAVERPLECLERVYKMAYKPHGFWSRLISRLALFAPDQNTYKTRELWSTGVYIEFSRRDQELYFLVEGKSDTTVRIETPSTKYGSCLLGRIVHHIDTLIEEWYKGLLQISLEGDPFVEYQIPCKPCQKEGIDPPFMFRLQTLIELSDKTDFVECEKHSRAGGVLRIADIAPDVMLQDFEEEHIINEAEITYNENSSLGAGALGTVCIGVYREQKIAVKIFKGTPTISTFQDFDRQPHYQLRQECSILRLLKHPSIVEFVGVLLRPRRCLLLELATYGSLDSVMKLSRGPMPRALVHRILLQVAEGLDYLHRMNVIYRDLKPQNILIVSKNLGVPVNAKITDFGISRLATGEGLISNEGTAGYMDPNITGREIYFSKVDIFSFGILIRELLTGQRVLSDVCFPVRIADAFNRGKAVLEEDYGWPDMRELLNYCIDPNPENRPSAIDITNWLSRADMLCLSGIYDPFEVPGLTLREYIVLVNGGETEVWVKTSQKIPPITQYSVIVIAFSENILVKRAEIVISHDVNAISPCYNKHVLVGGSNGTITIINAQMYTVERIVEIACKSGHPDHRHHVQSILFVEEFDPAYVILGMWNGQMLVYTDGDRHFNDWFAESQYTISVDKYPITRLVSYKANLLVAAHQVIHVYEIENFQMVYKFDLNLGGLSSTHITKVHVHRKMLWISLYSSTTVYVCKMTLTGAEVIQSIKLDERKTVNLVDQIESLKVANKSTSTLAFSAFDPTVFNYINSFDMRITCMSGHSSGMLLGLGNGMLLEVDSTNYKIQFVARRHMAPIRIIVPLTRGDHPMMVTFGKQIVGIKGHEVPNAVCCSWLVGTGDRAKELREYLEVRGTMVKRST